MALMANLGDLGTIGNNTRFQNRVANALAVAAAAVYSEASFASTSQAAASGLVLTFSAVPSWVTAGGGVADLTNAAAIPAGAIITAVTATTVTLSNAVTGVASGDVISFTQHARRAAFSNSVALGNYQIAAIVKAVLGNASIAAEANVNTLPDYAIPDTDIQFAVNSMWNMLAGS